MFIVQVKFGRMCMQGRKVFSKKGMQGSCWLCGTNSSHDCRNRSGLGKPSWKYLANRIGS